MKPAQDPISDKKSPDYEGDTRSRRIIDPDAASGVVEPPLDPVDSRERTDMFDRPKAGTDSGSSSGSGTFEEDKTDPALDRSLQKPPMTDPQDGKTLDPVESNPATPVDGKTFFEDTSNPSNSASRDHDAVVARTSTLSEVIAPKRLASRSLPARQRSVSGNKLADRATNTKSDSPRPLRWISAPLADGHVQL